MLKVLIAEDEAMIAMLTEEILVEHGYEVCGIASTVAEAVALAKSRKPDLAVIDLRLAAGGLGTEIVAQLGEMENLGVLYTTGASQIILTTTNGHARLAKPYQDTELVRSLEIVTELLSSGIASPPFPHGFQLLPVATTPGP